MKGSKASDLRAKSADELLVSLKDRQEALFNKRFQTEVEQIGNPSEIRKLRREIARIKTVLCEKGRRV